MPKDILDGQIDEASIARVSDIHVDRLVGTSLRRVTLSTVDAVTSAAKL